MDINKIPLSFPEVWDDTMRRSFSECNMKWVYYALFHADFPGKNIHLESGGTFASALETARRAFYEDFRSPEDSVTLGFRTLLQEWDDSLPINEERGDKKNLLSVAGAYASYFKRYALDTDPIRAYITEDGKCGAEFNFALPIDVTHPVTGNPIIYAGRFDLLGLYNDKLWVVDEKTTSRLGASWVKKWTLRSQFTGYCWGARKYNLPVVGAIIRGISILAGGYGHEEATVYRPQYAIDQWYEQLIREIEAAKEIYCRMRDAQERGEPLLSHVNRANSDVCSNYNGCQYMLLCDSRTPLEWIPNNFDYHDWNPVTRVAIDMPYGDYLRSLDAQ